MKYAAIRKPSRWLSLLLAALLCLLPLGAVAEDYGIVQGGSLNLRATPSIAGTLLGSYPSGTWVEVIERGAQWHKVRIGNLTGYMSAAYVSFENLTEIVQAKVSGANGYINLRAEPNTSAAVLGRYYNGTEVTVLSHTNGWYHVTVGSQTGYMVDTLVKLESQVVTTYAAVQTQNGGNVNIRQYPAATARILGSVRPGQQVQVLVKGRDWHKVQYGNIVGFMSAKYLVVGGSGSGGGVVTGTTAVVNNPLSTQVLMLRERPSQSAKVLAYYRNGKRVEVLENQGTWMKVRVDGTIGYMMGRYLKMETGSTTSPTSATIINPNGGSYVNFRAQPSLSAQVLATYSVGTSVTVLARYTDWAMVRIGDSTGYISTHFLRFSQ